MEVCRKRCDGKMKNCHEKEKAEVGKWDGKGEMEEEENGGRWERWRRGEIRRRWWRKSRKCKRPRNRHPVCAYRWEVMSIHLGVDRVV